MPPSVWKDQMPQNPIIFFDGNCGFCHAWVKFVAERDAEGRFQFAPLTGATFRNSFSAEEADAFPDSIVLLMPDSEKLFYSDAVIYTLLRLNPIWAGTGRIMRLLPQPIRDLVYRGIAAARRRLFRKPPGVCPLVPPELKSRFLK
ncbi:MAG: DUF393 domain-containing protein [Opitutae bacterium]|nr:DUF393 domain-containing protein [Opitutae bacterium]